MARALLSLKNIALTFGGEAVLTDANINVGEGERLALVGRNGSGKSTFLKIAAGLVEPDEGEIFVQPGTSISYLEQSPDLSAYANVIDYISKGQSQFTEDHDIAYLLDQLGLSAEADPKKFSGGELRRAAIARVLASDADILLLDEPTNHLDLPAIEWLEDELARTRAAIVLISHDRRFLENLSRKTLWLDRGETRELNKSFAHFEPWRDAYFEEEQLAQHKLARKIVQEEHWLRYGVTARRKRNVRRLGELQSLKQAHKSHRGPQGSANMSATAARDSGAIVIDAKQISKTYGERQIVRPLDLRLLRNDRLAIIGPNGAGKTTLISMLLGQLAPDTGSVQLGSNVEPAILDQNRMTFPLEMPLADVLTGGGGDTLVVNGQQRHVTAYMKDFLFQPEQMRTPIEKLSGGERARLLLAKLLALPSNLLVLDEPTNDLDLETLDLLEELVSAYKGTVLIVSHDRDFVDRTATQTLIADGDGRWTLYPGGYSDMLAQRGKGVEKRTEAPTKQPRSSAPIPKSTAQPATQPSTSRRKLSFKQKHALETLPAQMKTLSAKIEADTKRLADPSFYSKNPDEFSKISKELDSAVARHQALEDEWLELEILREELES